MSDLEKSKGLREQGTLAIGGKIKAWYLMNGKCGGAGLGAAGPRCGCRGGLGGGGARGVARPGPG